VAGCARPVALRADAAGNHYLDLVPFRDGWTPFDPTDPTHRAGRKATFLLDSWAEMTLVGPESLSLLTAIGSVRARTVIGFSGHSEHPLQTGIFLLYPPAGAALRPLDVAAGEFEEPGITFGSLNVCRVKLGPLQPLDVGPADRLDAAPDDFDEGEYDPAEDDYDGDEDDDDDDDDLDDDEFDDEDDEFDDDEVFDDDDDDDGQPDGKK
jgi:hypothetical protein